MWFRCELSFICRNNVQIKLIWAISISSRFTNQFLVTYPDGYSSRLAPCKFAFIVKLSLYSKMHVQERTEHGTRTGNKEKIWRKKVRPKIKHSVKQKNEIQEGIRPPRPSVFKRQNKNCIAVLCFIKFHLFNVAPVQTLNSWPFKALNPFFWFCNPFTAAVFPYSLFIVFGC